MHLSNMLARTQHIRLPYGWYLYSRRGIRIWRRVLVRVSSKMPYNWKCPECGQTVGTLGKTYPPTCQNPASHTSKVVVMELITKSRNNEVK